MLMNFSFIDSPVTKFLYSESFHPHFHYPLISISVVVVAFPSLSFCFFRWVRVVCPTKMVRCSRLARVKKLPGAPPPSDFWEGKGREGRFKSEGWGGGPRGVFFNVFNCLVKNKHNRIFFYSVNHSVTHFHAIYVPNPPASRNASIKKKYKIAIAGSAVLFVTLMTPYDIHK